MYQHFKLWFWWNFVIRKNEFNKRLDYMYLYTKMNAPAWTQNSRGRVLSMLTSWTTNWMELMAKCQRRKM